ncbi:ribbon-helix-helix domain-containing protein [Mesorhizobium sp. M0514]|uniref:ribbon-helix-helix protein, CopG family n=1 Tax=Mesorhizobium sp. M0514 TaxID=2956955 RepID=UPI003336522A
MAARLFRDISKLMSKSTGDITKRKRPPAAGTPVLVRLQPDLLGPLDKAAAELSEASRPEAIRRIIKDWLIGHGYLTH